MWGNTEVAELIEWLREFNSGKQPDEMVGFYGMDVYGQWEAMDDLLEYAGLYIPEHYDAIASKCSVLPISTATSGCMHGQLPG